MSEKLYAEKFRNVLSKIAKIYSRRLGSSFSCIHEIDLEKLDNDKYYLINNTTKEKFFMFDHRFVKSSIKYYGCKQAKRMILGLATGGFLDDETKSGIKG